MRVIELDASGWSTSLDFYCAIGDAVGAKSGVNSVDALLEYMVWDWERMGGIEPPYVVRVVNATGIPTEVADEIALLASIVKESQGGHLEVVLEWPPGALLGSPEEKLNAAETDLMGSWIKTGSNPVGDIVERRIAWLIECYLVEVATSAHGYDVLYRDPNDGRYWELTHPRGPIYGSGPRRLTNVTETDARLKFAFSD